MPLPSASELGLRAQPIVRLDTRAYHGAEVFLRWIHPERGDVPAGEWIPEAAACGALADYTLDLLPELTRLATKLSTGRISWNLSNGELADDRVVEAFTALDPAVRSHLAWEIHHAQFPAPGRSDRDPPPADLDERLAHARRCGLEVWLDDLGDAPGGERIAERPDLDLVKLDRSVLHRDPTGLDELAPALLGRGLPVVVEGIEHPHEAERARAAGLALAQGFLFALPLSPEALIAFAARRPQR